MSASPIRIIAMREIRDTITDWRLLTPILVMVVVFPTMLVAGANIFINFIGDPQTVSRIIPFAMLLIGFIPAAFSLITALESFVGERERNSLEALLAMPISDNQLYISKLVAALLPPLLSSLLAMFVFALTLRLRQPSLFAEGLQAEYILTVTLLITIKAVLMVASAVIISSHTSSIRAANLLASFVLLPTAALIQIEAIYIIANQWSRLRLFALVLVILAVLLIRTGMGTFNREEILSREHEQLNLGRIWRTFVRFLKTYHPVTVPSDQYADERFSFSRFYRHDFPALLRDYRQPLVVGLIAAIAGIVGGIAIGLNYRLPGINIFIPRQLDFLAQGGPIAALALWLNNIRVAFLSGLLSMFTFGLFSFLVPTVAFGLVSLFATRLAVDPSLYRVGPLAFVLAYVLPHGIVELPTAILGAALGIRLGAALMASARGVTVGHNLLWSLAQFLKVWALVIVPLYLIAALIEGFITPLVIRLFS